MPDHGCRFKLKSSVVNAIHKRQNLTMYVLLKLTVGYPKF